MGQKPVRAVGSVTGVPDVEVPNDGAFRLVLGDMSEYENAKLRLVNVDNVVTWVSDDQEFIFETGGKAALVVPRTAIHIPTTGALLFVRGRSGDVQFLLKREASAFDHRVGERLGEVVPSTDLLENIVQDLLDSNLLQDVVDKALAEELVTDDGWEAWED